MRRVEVAAIVALACVAARLSASLDARGVPAPRAPIRSLRQQVPSSSRIMMFDLAARTSRMVHEANGVWEAPNWSRDGRVLLVNSGGRLYRLPVDGASAPQPVALDPSLRCNNDHDFSPDGQRLAISASSPASRQSQIYVADADGSNARLVVSSAPSYFHGWSPDGKYLSFVANRDGKQFDLYRVPSAGGQEERLTVNPAYDDGTDYSRDGRWIYFNSNRGGGWDIWRMPADGAGPEDRKAERVTADDREDWFPHPSPDGKWLLFLSFPPGTEGHDHRNLRVQLRAMPLPGASIGRASAETLVEFTGGQGTINVNSWSPDSTRFAYVAYASATEGRHPPFPVSSLLRFETRGLRPLRLSGDRTYAPRAVPGRVQSRRLHRRTRWRVRLDRQRSDDRLRGALRAVRHAAHRTPDV